MSFWLALLEKAIPAVWVTSLGTSFKDGRLVRWIVAKILADFSTSLKENKDNLKTVN